MERGRFGDDGFEFGEGGAALTTSFSSVGQQEKNELCGRLRGTPEPARSPIDGNVPSTSRPHVRPVTPKRPHAKTLLGVDMNKPSISDIRLLRAVLIGESEAPVIIQASTAALQLGSDSSHSAILHLATATLFNLSKDKKNDRHFVNGDFATSALRVLGISSLSPQARVHLAGTIKNISNDPKNRQVLFQKGAVELCCRLVGSEIGTNEVVALSIIQERFDERTWMLLLSTTSTLRNMAIDRAHARAFREAGAMHVLANAFKRGMENEDLVYNVSRIFSKLSLDPECKVSMEIEDGFAELLVSVLKAHMNSHHIVVRVAFVIGNLAMDSEAFRESIARCYDAIPVLMELCVDTNQDCLSKLVRAVANLSLLESIGRQVASTARATDVLISVLSDGDVDPQEEIVLFATAALANLTFYRDYLDLQQSVAEDVCWSKVIAMLAGPNEECVLEASRLCANLSQNHSSRGVMQGTPVVQTLVLLLDHSDPTIVAGVCGALVNFAADEGAIFDLIEMEVPEKLQGALELATSPQIDHMEALDLAQVCSKALLNLISCHNNLLDPRCNTLRQVLWELPTKSQPVHLHLPLQWIRYRKSQLFNTPLGRCLGDQVKDILARFDGSEVRFTAPILSLLRELIV
ncbi:hypothetical protein BSKO_04531 [Bryopsis sp. KO-2023]|nr:hypothetical protein BSKO_04531 [Bryopsis sp. KO-2023]